MLLAFCASTARQQGRCSAALDNLQHALERRRQQPRLRALRGVGARAATCCTSSRRRARQPMRGRWHRAAASLTSTSRPPATCWRCWPRCRPPRCGSTTRRLGRRAGPRFALRAASPNCWPRGPPHPTSHERVCARPSRRVAQRPSRRCRTRMAGTARRRAGAARAWRAYAQCQARRHGPPDAAAPPRAHRRCRRLRPPSRRCDMRLSLRRAPLASARSARSVSTARSVRWPARQRAAAAAAPAPGGAQNSAALRGSPAACRAAGTATKSSAGRWSRSGRARAGPCAKRWRSSSRPDALRLSCACRSAAS